MGNLAIEVEGLSKMYRIGRSAHLDLRDAILSVFRKREPVASSEFWALKDLSFTLEKGQSLGVIGRNGAGKSTLLKLLSRITHPTEGRFTTDGRMASLLEVGAGFHYELSGRENIFLQGTLLGMSRQEVRDKMDEIVAFSGVEKFLDTPVKRYSSGMFVRLAFAVAAHLEPEILIVDEVLAVGDAEFQRKCLGKMSDVASQGRTVLFVSHNLGAVQQFCQQSVYLKQGRRVDFGPTKDVISRYMADIEKETASGDLRSRRDRSGDQQVILTSARPVTADGRPAEGLVSGEDAFLEIGYEAQPSYKGERIAELSLELLVRNAKGEFVTLLSNRREGRRFRDMPRSGKIYCELPAAPFMPGDFYFDALLAAETAKPSDHLTQAFRVNVAQGEGFRGAALNRRIFQSEQGVYLKSCWHDETALALKD